MASGTPLAAEGESVPDDPNLVPARRDRRTITAKSIISEGMPMIDESVSYVEQISMLLREDGGHIECADEDERLEIRRQKRSMRIAIFVMMACGASYDFLAKSVYLLMPGDDAGISGLKTNKYITCLLTFGSFIACAIPPTLSKKNREAFVENAELGFLTKLACPSLLDLLVTGFRFVALVFLAPSVASILKNSWQIISIAVLNRMRGKKLTAYQWSSLGAALCGDIIITVADSVNWDGKHVDPDSNSSGSKKIMGIVIISLAGILGGVRNIIEEMILHDSGFPDGALLMVESWVSAFFVLLVGMIIGFMNEWDSFAEDVKAFVGHWVIPVFFIIFLFTSYGKDAGKLKVVKYGSAMLAKVLALLFPVGTWVLSIIGGYASQFQIGEPLVWPQSFLRLVGFLVITMSTIFFVKLKKKK